MSDCQYSLMVLELIRSVATNEHEVHEIYQHIIATDEYMDAHGRYVYETDNGLDHSESKRILNDWIKNK